MFYLRLNIFTIYSIKNSNRFVLQDKQLHSSRGIIISNQSLVLQSISKASFGQYFCRATNVQGSVSSNEVFLDIKCKC